MTMTVLTIVQVLLAIAMIAIILVQRGPGASAGSGFGAGASATVFGSRGSGSFLTRTTSVLAAVFFGLSLMMAVLVSRTIEPATEIDLGVMAGEDAATGNAIPDQPSLNTLDNDVPTLPTTVEADATDVPVAPPAGDEEVPDGDN